MAEHAISNEVVGARRTATAKDPAASARREPVACEVASPDPMLFPRSTASSDIAIVTAASFALIAAIVGGLADGPWRRTSESDWQLRGTLAPTDARNVEPAAGLATASIASRAPSLTALHEGMKAV